MNEKKIEWGFKAINPSDYEIIIETDIDNKLLYIIFNKAKAKLARTKGINVKGNIENIESMTVPVEYYNMTKTVLHKVLKNIKKEIAQDKITILSSVVSDAVFIRNEAKVWHFKAVLQGQYIDKR